MGIGNIGWTEFVVILAIALIFFGPRRLPGIAQTLGKSLREFQKAMNEVKSEIARAGREADARDAITRIPPRPAETAARPASDVEGSPYASESTREAEVVVEEEEVDESESDAEVTITPKRTSPGSGGAGVEPASAPSRAQVGEEPESTAGAKPEAEAEGEGEPEPKTDETDVQHANSGDSHRS